MCVYCWRWTNEGDISDATAFKDNTNLPADTRGQVLHNQAVLRAHWRRISATQEKKKKKVNTVPSAERHTSS